MLTEERGETESGVPLTNTAVKGAVKLKWWGLKRRLKHSQSSTAASDG